MASQWPPRSPHDAQASTPGGRERLRRLALRSSPSPSPSRMKSARMAEREELPVDAPDDAASDDEETLQLQLQAIQAKLRLKKLQAQKAAAKPTGVENIPRNRATTPPGRATASAGLREVPLQSRLAAARERMEGSPRGSGDARGGGVQVPASPVKKATADTDGSPKRVLLGIDKGLRAADVSLKRAPSARREEGDAGRGGYLRRTKTSSSSSSSSSSNTTRPPRPVSFNERLASARTEEISRQEKQERIKKLRTTGFDIGQREMEQYKSAAVELPDQGGGAPEYSRAEIVGRNGGATDPSSSSKHDGGATGPSFEPYSGLHLSKRILPHAVLARAVSGKKTYVIKDLMRHVKAPDWTLPDIEQDVVVLAVVASKSDPRSHKPGPATGRQQDRGKYMVVTLVDLALEVELFLFNSGFERFWKLTTGTVVAVLNPSVMAPPQGREATGRFSLVINSDADTILEVGSARDLGFCKSVKRDGQLCNSWVNARRTEHCEFHTNEAVRKVRSRRMELNGAGMGGDKKYSRQKRPEEDKQGRYDRATQSRWFVSGSGQSASPFDDERGGPADRAEREEVLKRRLARMERERDMAKRLGKMGAGAGKEYMSRAAAASAASSASLGSSTTMSSGNPATSSSSLSSQNEGSGRTGRTLKADARALGLVAPRGEQPRVDLGPIKRKRPESSLSSSTTAGSVGRTAMGWGTSLKDKLARMKDGEKLDPAGGGPFVAAKDKTGDKSPVRKKTRFVTDKGIREAGRESLGEPLSVYGTADDDDDDDLIVVK